MASPASAASPRRASLFSNKKGIDLLPQSAAEILLGIGGVILAILVFVMVYRLVFGGTSAEDDARTLAGIIAEMADSELSYEQRAVMLRLDENWIVGFDKASQESKVSATVWTPLSEYTFVRAPDCNGKECICSAKSNSRDGEVENCFIIKRKGSRLIDKATNQDANIIPMYLVSDYTTYPFYISTKNLPDRTASKGFIAAVKLINLEEMRDDERAKAVANYIVDKRILTDSEGRKTIVITIMPDTPYARNRAFNYFVCPGGSSTEERCAGLTGESSITRLQQQENIRYCAPGFDNDCGLVTLYLCAEGKEVSKVCKCGDTVITHGICKEGKQYPIQCEGVDSCDDYCKLDSSTAQGGAPTVYINLDHCTSEEAPACNDNPCGLRDTSCSVKVNDGKGQCRSVDEDEKELSGVAKAAQEAISGKQSRKAVYIDTERKYLVGFNSKSAQASPDPFARPEICKDVACLCLRDDDEIESCEVVSKEPNLKFTHTDALARPPKITAPLDSVFGPRVHIMGYTEQDGAKIVQFVSQGDDRDCFSVGAFAGVCGEGTRLRYTKDDGQKCCVPAGG